MQLSEWLMECGVTKRFIAKNLEIHPSYLFQIETKRLIPSLKLAKRIAKLTEGKVALGDLIDLEVGI